MKKIMTAALLCCVSLPVMAQAASFKPLGKTGMGGAGVAITTDSFAGYWNPAGLAFHDKSFSAKFNGGVGVNLTSALAENTDKLGKLDFDNLNDLNVDSNPAALTAAGEAVQFIGILEDIDNRGGTMTATPGGALAFQYANYGLGAFVSSELNVYVNEVDRVNIRPASDTTTLSQFATNIGATTGRPTPIFSSSQYSAILAAFSGNAAVVDTLERQLAASNETGLTTDQMTQALIDMGGSFSGSNTSIDNNTTTLALKGLLLTEVPIAYGYKFDLKKFGELGIGGAVKVMMGTTYGSIVKIQEAKGSEEIIEKVTDSKTDSTTLGVDLGVVWRKELPVVGQFNAGLVAKNLNSPEFDNPAGFAGKTKVEPQVRMGVAVDPFSWLTVAADMDMTKNKTLAQGVDSRNFGFGAEFRPFSAFALRCGMYTNLVDSSVGPVGTFGLSLGPQWLRFDLDGAVATKTTKFDNDTYPREASVEFALSTMF